MDRLGGWIGWWVDRLGGWMDGVDMMDGRRDECSGGCRDGWIGWMEGSMGGWTGSMGGCACVSANVNRVLDYNS